MTIKARFASQCPKCRQSIAVNDLVNWEPGAKATHTICPVVAASVAPEPARLTADETGVYVLTSGQIVKVVESKEHPGQTYAKFWAEIGGTRVTEAGTFVNGDYFYKPGLVQQVAAEGRKMTLDEAKAFIVRYGKCVRCSKQLKDGEKRYKDAKGNKVSSVDRGIGPTCIKYFTAGTTGADLLAGSPASAPQAAVPAYTRSRWSRPGDDELEDAA